MLPTPKFDRGHSLQPPILHLGQRPIQYPASRILCGSKSSASIHMGHGAHHEFNLHHSIDALCIKWTHINSEPNNPIPHLFIAHYSLPSYPSIPSTNTH